MEIELEMPETDAHVGTCGFPGDGFAQRCKNPGVIRVEVETREYDLYEEEREFHPYTGETVMVAVCKAHKEKMERDYAETKRFRQERADAREVKAAEVARLKTELESAEYELRNM